MTVAESIGTFIGAPLAIVVVLVLLNLRGARRRPRYRPGQPWEYPPIWWEPHPQVQAPEGHGAGHGGDAHAAVGRGVSRPAVGAGSTSGDAAHPGGPLGGARGTW